MFNYLLIIDKLFVDYEKLAYIVAVTLLGVSNRLNELENLCQVNVRDMKKKRSKTLLFVET